MATIRDIAKKASVSPATVSRVLNNDLTLSVTDATRAKIIKIAEELNYSKASRKNQIRVALVQWYSESQEQDDIYYMMIREGIEKQIQRFNFDVVRVFNNDFQTIEGDIDGIIAVGKFSSEQVDNMKKYSKNIVFIDDDQFENKFDTVLTDFQYGVQNSLDFFLKQGIKEIGIIYGEERSTDNLRVIPDKRFDCYKNYLKQKELFNLDYTFKGDFSKKSGYEQMKLAIRQLDKLPKAFFISNDPMSAGALQALQETNISVPDDVQIFSYNNTSVAKYVNPELSSVSVATVQMGAAAVQLLYDLLTNEHHVPYKLELSTELVIRDSTCK
ncbi:LacI family DNA-binding transcriptional regulator [Companilactobacillus sp. HBUAS59699]|uniref:LacI family DNA-binding transcriptional regulator n=1 Tax=Companilactobacillus sp. HBUAS59699 TaxID=3109358 RepID=UPI002FEF408B